jgi:hypothetical protein
MTRKEIMIGMIPVEVDEATMQKVAIDSALDLDLTYVAADKEKIELAVAEVLWIVARRPGFSEGSLTVNYSPGALLQLRAEILSRYNLPSGGISSSVKW